MNTIPNLSGPETRVFLFTQVLGIMGDIRDLALCPDDPISLPFEVPKVEKQTSAQNKRGEWITTYKTPFGEAKLKGFKEYSRDLIFPGCPLSPSFKITDPLFLQYVKFLYSICEGTNDFAQRIFDRLTPEMLAVIERQVK